MYSRTVFEEALEYLRNNPNVNFGNNLSNEEAIKLVQSFYELGANRVTTTLCEDSLSEGLEFAQELYLYLPKLISLDLMMKIMLAHPNGVSQRDSGTIILWWN